MGAAACESVACLHQRNRSQLASLASLLRVHSHQSIALAEAEERVTLLSAQGRELAIRKAATDKMGPITGIRERLGERGLRGGELQA